MVTKVANLALIFSCFFNVHGRFDRSPFLDHRLQNFESLDFPRKYTRLSGWRHIWTFSILCVFSLFNHVSLSLKWLDFVPLATTSVLSSVVVRPTRVWRHWRWGVPVEESVGDLTGGQEPRANKRKSGNPAWSKQEVVNRLTIDWCPLARGACSYSKECSSS